MVMTFIGSMGGLGTNWMTMASDEASTLLMPSGLAAMRKR
jgi:hypothetical protein